MDFIFRVTTWITIWFISFMCIGMFLICGQLAVNNHVDLLNSFIISASSATIITLLLLMRSIVKKARVFIYPDYILIKNNLFHEQRIYKKNIKYIGNIGEAVAIFNHNDELIGQSFDYPNKTINALIDHGYYQAEQVNPYINQFEKFKRPWPDIHPKALKVLKRAYRKYSTDFNHFRNINKKIGKYGVLAKLDGNMQFNILRVKNYKGR